MSASVTEELRQRRVAAAKRLATMKPDDPAASSLKAEINEIDRLIAGATSTQVKEELPLPERPFRPGQGNLRLDEVPTYLATLEKLQAEAQARLDTQQPGSLVYKNTRLDLSRFEQEIAYYRQIVRDPDLYQRSVAAEKNARVASAGNDLSKGIGCLAIGAVLSVIGYFAAGPGDRFVVFWGAMALGAFLIIRGLINRRA